jgi:hypothetical protein
LYNLETDPQEKKNIADQHPEIVKEIETLMSHSHVFNSDWPLLVDEIKKKKMEINSSIK